MSNAQLAAPKDPNVAITYSIDWSSRLVPELARKTEYELGEIVRPPRFEGFYLECTLAGWSSQYHRELPRVAGQTAEDGSVQWTVRHPASVTVPTVQSAVWTVPTGITLDSQSEDGHETFVTLSGGTDGQDYELVCRMTPTAGNPVDQTIIVPVRQQ